MASSVLRGLSRTAAATFPAALSASARSLSAPAVQAIPKAQGSGALAAAFAAAAAAAAAAVAASPADNGAICEAKSMTIEEFELLALTPLDGRYHGRVGELSNYFSEHALIKYRVMVEVEYFIELCGLLPQLSGVPKDKFGQLRKIYQDFSVQDAAAVKKIEGVTNHDVKAVEYFLKEHFDALGLGAHKEFIHFALTSQDVNNVAQPLMLRDAIQQSYLPTLKKFIGELRAVALAWDFQPMLARTHGQPATPTRVGKEMMVFVERLEHQVAHLEQLPFGCKMGGATGNCAAHVVAYPEVEWETAITKLASRLGLQRQHFTTQISHYDDVAAHCDCMARINSILTDFCRDMWTYVSLNYFTQTIKKNEVGSSAMPHKVNPIDFENGEGNFGVANSVFHHLSSKLPISRLQRDLTDSTVMRNMGVPIGHSVLGLKSASRGLSKMNLNSAALNKDLDESWAVVAEALQTVLRREGYPQPYEALKALTRVKGGITEAAIRDFIAGLDVSPAVKAELFQISPHNFTGRAFVRDEPKKK